MYILLKTGWNSLMEGMRNCSGQEDPVELLASQNEAVEKAVLQGLQQKNQKKETLVKRKEWELQAKQAYLGQQQKI